MKAVVYQQYGDASQLSVQERAQPIPKDNEVLIKIHAVSLNASDMEGLTANPAFVRMWGPFKPKYQILGSDIAGTIIAIGTKVTRFKIGDKVFGDVIYTWGGLAEYVCAPENTLIHKDEQLTFSQAAALPQSATIAYQSLNYKRPTKLVEEILIIGAGGGSGTFAIQLAKMEGAHVTAVDREQKFEMMKELGADKVIDYQKVDVTKSAQKYDRIIAIVSPNSVFEYRKILKPNGLFLLTGGTIRRVFQTLIFGSLISLFGNKKMSVFAHEPMKDMNVLQDMVVQGKLKTVIDKTFTLQDTATAFRYLLNGEIAGKAVVKIV